MEWFYVKDGASCGPVSQTELAALAKAGTLKADDLVWNSSMGEEWVRAATVEGLSGTASDRLSLVSSTRNVHDARDTDGVKLVDPVKDAWARMVLILFRPFEIGKWFALGFSAWLASLGGGGGSGSFNGSPGNMGRNSSNGTVTVDGMLTGIEETWAQANETLQGWGALIVGVIVAIVLVGVVLGLVFLWLQSRGQFMLLDNVLKNRGDVSEPWRVLKEHGNSLFRWSLVYGIICLLITLGLLALSWPLVLKPCVEARAFVTPAVGGIVTVVLLFAIYGIITFYIGRFLKDFIVPLMYKYDMTAGEAWGKFLGLYRANSGRFVLYGLFFLVLQLCAGMA
ncbi:MAG: DUF4339 domain-containing protein, partial [Verrucomicrobia bacterium]|nr:DUF4339 domain-containing protein [Verrucomicrobiota bacterium]